MKMKTAEQKRTSTTERNETKDHHVIDFSTARTDKQSNVFKPHSDGDGLNGRNKNLRRNEMTERQLNEFRKIAKSMTLLDGDYKIVKDGEIKAFHLPYTRAVEWNKFYKGKVIKM